jgi:hypothetical protein
LGGSVRAINSILTTLNKNHLRESKGRTQPNLADAGLASLSFLYNGLTVRITTQNKIKVGPRGFAPIATSFADRERTSARSPVRLQAAKILCVVLAAVPALAGCASHQVGPNRPVPIETDIQMVSSLAYPQDLVSFASNWPDKGAARNEMLTARMYVADMEYQVYEANLTKEMQDEGLLGTAASLGLTTSSTLVSPAVTKTILSALATGVTGLDKAYNEKELLSNAMQALQTQMRADRNAQAAQIYARMFTTDKKPTPISQYTWTMALSDAEAYYQAGTISSALIGLTRTAARADSNAALARAAAGPNASQVTTAQQMAAPISPAVVPASRTVLVAPVSSPHERAPAPPKSVLLNPPGLGSFEKNQLPKDEIQDYQSALCLPRDGNVVSLRKGMIDFFRRKDVDDSQRADLIEQRGILQGDVDELSKLSVNLHCGQN